MSPVDEYLHPTAVWGRPRPAVSSKGEEVTRACVIVPALNASATVGRVVDDLRDTLGIPVIVVDDGSADATGEVARARGATVVRHERNRGKGAAIRRGLREAKARDFQLVVTVDADGQHPAPSARAVLDGSKDPRALVLGVRDLLRDGAPASNRFGNGVSNFFLSHFARRPLKDTQCGLRRYPVDDTLALGVRASGYAFEGEVVLRALARGLPLVEVPVSVVYAPVDHPGSHFRRVVDPTRIVATVVRTVFELRLGGS
jgi:glycosyltransferase involved in cell wall biosynthesis